MDKGRAAGVVALAMVAGLLGTGSASAAPTPAGNAAFASAGVEVFPEGAVGAGCRVLGFCDGVAGALGRSARAEYASSRAGEAVLVTCRSADLARVVGFFGDGDDVVTGWANASGLRMRGDDPVPACGALV
ncbi:MAG: hypothetical protein QOK35_3426 [Pseudonocardiales bacterium]|jgi:hypothetical protein|nr:hypothetical protein [Pseudonocardiales bacterium]